MSAQPATPCSFATWSRRALHHLNSDPDAPTIVSITPEGIEDWSRAQLAARTAGASEFLDAHGVNVGEVVPALLTSRPASVALMIAGALSKRPLAPLGPRLTSRELVACLELIDGPALVTEPQWTELATEVAAVSGKRLAVFEEPRPSTAMLRADGRADDVAFVVHTSGTTGLPKQVLVHEGRLARRAEVLGALCKLDQDTRLVTAALFHHVAGIGQVAATLAHGGAVVMVPSFSVDAWRSVTAMEPTHAVLMPSAIEMLLSEHALRVPSLRVAAYGTAPIHPDTVRRMQQVMPEVDLINLFGQTEGTPLTVLTPEDHRRAAAGHEELLSSVGQAGPGVELLIHDADADGLGEVWARSAHSFVVDENGWQHTGDMGRLVNGYLYLAGRRGDKIIRGGENVLPLEVEQILETHPGVVAAGVAGKPDRRLGETVVAFVVPANPAAPPNTEDLRAYCRDRLAGFKVPVEWTFTEALPRNPMGKLLRRELARWVAES